VSTAPPALAPDLADGLKRLKMAAMRRLASELLLTAKTQRWNCAQAFSAALTHGDFDDNVRHRVEGILAALDDRSL
jgi:hypothetical protein